MPESASTSALTPLAESSDGASARRRGAIAAAAAFALVGVLAAASRGAPVWGELRRGEPDQVRLLVDVGVYGLLGLLVAFTIAFALHRRRHGPDEPPEIRTAVRQSIPYASVAMAAFALFAISRAELYPGGPSDRGSLISLDAPGNRITGSITDSRNPPVIAGDRAPDAPAGAGERIARRILDPLTLLGLLFAGLVAWFWLSSRRRKELARRRVFRVDGSYAEIQRQAEEMRATVVSTIDAMLADPDPRTAIIGAYARLLEGLNASGAGRREHEAPLEHLRRVLRTLRVRPEPLRQLTSLFQIARFSTQPLTPAHRDRALDALRAAAADLGGATVGSGTDR